MSSRFLVLWLVGCGPMPFSNDPPELRAINGVPMEEFYELGKVTYFSPGDQLSLELEIKDPERDEYSIALMWGPPGVVIDQEQDTIAWEVSEQLPFPWNGLVLILDDHREKRRGYAEYYLPYEPVWESFGNDNGEAEF